MISKNKIKYIQSLELKKNRNKENVFVAEGPKLVEALLQVSTPCFIAATADWIEVNSHLKMLGMVEVTEEELKKISFLQHPQQVLGIFKQEPQPKLHLENSLSIALDDIQDPGNLGTIIRIADWFGVRTILCSENTVDVYNPKVIQATMGSIANVNVAYVNLEEVIKALPKTFPIYGTLLDGENIYQQTLERKGLIIMGNEGKGISSNIKKYITHKLLIPGDAQKTAESLNVAIATAITCAEFQRANL